MSARQPRPPDDTTLARRRAELEKREHVHLVCPVCEWLVVPPDGLVIDRSIRLAAHLADEHDWQFDMLRIGMSAVERALVEAAA